MSKNNFESQKNNFSYIIIAPALKVKILKRSFSFILVILLTNCKSNLILPFIKKKKKNTYVLTIVHDHSQMFQNCIKSIKYFNFR